MPMIFTKPPSGMARTPYSTPLRCVLHTRGPKPRKNCVAFMPLRRAVQKWPSSCSMMDTARPRMNTTNHRL
jgi:hypothetical protein